MEEFTNDRQIRLDKAKNAILLKRVKCKTGFCKSSVSAERELTEKRIVQDYENFKKTMSNENKHALFNQSIRDDRSNLLKREFNLNTYTGEEWQTLSYISGIYMFETMCIEEFFGVLIPKREFIEFFSDLIDPIVSNQDFEMGFSQKVRNKWIVKLYYEKKAEALPLFEKGIDLV